jgi:hypothetical protein
MSFRFVGLYLLSAVCFGAIVFAAVESGTSALSSYFDGKQITLKIDMPGSQKGVDLSFNRPTPMDWKQYSSRIKQFGPAIRKGDVATVTSVVVKKDRIEFQLDGGGFGTAWDDTDTSVTAASVDKSDYEKRLQRQISQSTDPDERKRLQRELDKERARRQRQDAANQQTAQIASQMKGQQVAGNRMRGGSRFNLRWSGSIPPDQLTPEAVMQRLAAYVEFNNIQNGPAPSQAAVATDTSPTGQLKQGMSVDDVARLLGQGNKLSESVGTDGLKTQVFEYVTGDRRADVTYVNGVVVKYSISSR